MNDPIMRCSVTENGELSGRRLTDMSRYYFLSHLLTASASSGDQQQQQLEGRAPALTLLSTLRGPNGEQQYQVNTHSSLKLIIYVCIYLLAIKTFAVHCHWPYCGLFLNHGVL